MTDKILGALALLLGALALYFYVHANDLKGQILTLQAEQSRAVATAVEARTQELTRRTDIQRKALDAQILETQAAADAADRLRDRERRLRNQLATLSSRGDPVAPGECPADLRPTVDTLAGLFGSCVSEYRRMAEEARRARSAGLLCERYYDSLIPPEEADLRE